MNRISRLEQQYNQLTQRERVLMFFVAIIVVGFILLQLLSASFADLNSLTRQKKLAISTIATNKEQLSLYYQQQLIDPNKALQERLERLIVENEKLDNQLGMQTVNMVPAHEMPKLLTSLLEQIKGVELTSFNSIPPTPLLVVEKPVIENTGKEKSDQTNKDSDNSDSMNLYSHGIVLKFEGDYFSILKFLDAVESMPSKLYWKRLDYNVGEYPNASVELALYTLSLNKEFISVAK